MSINQIELVQEQSVILNFISYLFKIQPDNLLNLIKENLKMFEEDNLIITKEDIYIFTQKAFSIEIEQSLITINDLTQENFSWNSDKNENCILTPRVTIVEANLLVIIIIEFKTRTRVYRMLELVLTI